MKNFLKTFELCLGISCIIDRNLKACIPVFPLLWETLNLFELVFYNKPKCPSEALQLWVTTLSLSHS